MVNGKRVVALCPMGAHSERVKCKNWRILNGRPLYRYVLSMLEKCRTVDAIAVNTDAPPDVVADLRSMGIEVIDRPAELRGSHVDFNRILEHDIAKVPADIYLQTHVTAPFLSAGTVDAAVRAFAVQCDKYDSLLSVQRMYKRFWTLDGTPLNHDERQLLRLQDVPPLLMDAAAIYIFTRESFAKHNHRHGDSPMFWDIPDSEAIDIDTVDDFQHAEALMREREARR